MGWAVTLPAAGGFADAAEAALGAVGDVLVLVQVTRGEGRPPHKRMHRFVTPHPLALAANHVMTWPCQPLCLCGQQVSNACMCTCTAVTYTISKYTYYILQCNTPYLRRGA